MIDDNVDVSVLKTQYPNITFLQIPAAECAAKGFRDLNVIVSKKAVIAWDKAVYYFSIINAEHNNVWFIEDDVFFYNERTMINIDEKYPDDDIISSSQYGPNNNPSRWWWPRININLPLPYTNGMVCALRLSSELRQHICTYALVNGKLFFLEAFFPTLALYHNMKRQTVPELSRVEYKMNYLQKPAKINSDTSIIKIDSISVDYIYHAFKCMEDHTTIRNYIRNNA